MLRGTLLKKKKREYLGSFGVRLGTQSGNYAGYTPRANSELPLMRFFFVCTLIELLNILIEQQKEICDIRNTERSTLQAVSLWDEQLTK